MGNFVPYSSLENAHRLRLLYCAAWSEVSPLLAIRGLVVARFIARLSVPLFLDIQKRLDAAENGIFPHASEITDLFESAIHQIRTEGGTGLLLVVDELGKFLEYAAQNPVHDDLFVLQSLAEFAARSAPTPLLMLTILHQAFERYAQRLATSQREEWAKGTRAF